MRQASGKRPLGEPWWRSLALPGQCFLTGAPMALGKRPEGRPAALFVAASDMHRQAYWAAVSLKAGRSSRMRFRTSPSFGMREEADSLSEARPDRPFTSKAEASPARRA